MPTPLLYERQDDFIQRCIPEIVNEEGKDKSQATAMCYQIWSNKG